MTPPSVALRNAPFIELDKQRCKIAALRNAEARSEHAENAHNVSGEHQDELWIVTRQDTLSKHADNRPGLFAACSVPYFHKVSSS